MFSTIRSTRKTLAAAATVAAAAVAGLVVSAGPASAATFENHPWIHTITVETTNVQVKQHNWIRADIYRYDGYQSRSYAYGTGAGGYVNRYTPFAESTGGYIQVRDNDTYVDGSTWNTIRYDGGVNVVAELDMTTHGPNAVFPAGYPDRNYGSWRLGPNSSTGWQHIEVIGAGGDYIKMDYRVTNTATPQA